MSQETAKVAPRPTAKLEKTAKLTTPRSEIRDRVKVTLLSYPGIDNHEELLKRKSEEKREQMAEKESEYWAWHRKMTSEVGPRWKMPNDQYVGKRNVEEEILEKVDKAHKEMAERAGTYMAWVKEMEQKRQEETNAKVLDRQRELKMFAEKAKEQTLAREASLGEDREARAAAAGRYWTWLSDTKTNIAKREITCAPFVRPSGGKSVEELTNMKREALAQEIGEREREYSQWVHSIRNKHSQSVPELTKCYSVEERDAINLEKAKKGREKLNEKALEYNKWVKEMENERHERMMTKVRAKLLADQEFRRVRQQAKQELARKTEEAKQQGQSIAQESQRAVQEMYERVQSKPLMVEQAYRFGKFMK